MAERRHITGDKIHFRSTLTWSVSSPVERFLSHFADTLLTEGRLSLAQHQLPIRDVTIPRIPRFQSEMQFRCLSPITMSTKRERDGKQVMHYCMPDDPAFSELVRQNLIRKHEAIHGRSSNDGTLSFAFDKTYINRRQGRVTRLVDYKGIKIRGSLMSVPCYRKSGVNPDWLRMRFWRQKQRRFRHGRSLNKFYLDLSRQICYNIFTMALKGGNTMPIYEKLMGNPFIDAGICGICEWLGRNVQPEQVTTDDLEKGC